MNVLALVSALALAQTYPVVSNSTITANGSRVLTGLTSGELDFILDVSGRVDGGGAALTFNVAECDPQPPNTVLDGGVHFRVGPVTASVALAPVHAKLFGSSAVMISWTVDGGSYFSGVNASLVNRSTVANPSVEGVDGGRAVLVSTLASSQTFSKMRCLAVTCSSAHPTVLPSDAGQEGMIVSSVVLTNPVVLVGPPNAVDAGVGVPVFAGVSYPFNNNASPILACEAASSTVVDVCQVFP